MAYVSDGGHLTARLHHHRFRIVLWIAVIEGLIVALTNGIHIWTIVILGVIIGGIVIAMYLPMFTLINKIG